jgi:hypothetical protein
MHTFRTTGSSRVVIWILVICLLALGTFGVLLYRRVAAPAGSLQLLNAMNGLASASELMRVVQDRYPASFGDILHSEEPLIAEAARRVVDNKTVHQCTVVSTSDKCVITLVSKRTLLLPSISLSRTIYPRFPVVGGEEPCVVTLSGWLVVNEYNARLQRTHQRLRDGGTAR